MPDCEEFQEHSSKVSSTADDSGLQTPFNEEYVPRHISDTIARLERDYLQIVEAFRIVERTGSC